MKLIQWGIFAGLTVLIAALFHFLPRLRKRNLYFGVTVAEGFRDSVEGCAIAREFRAWVWSGTVVSLIALWVLLELRWTLPFSLASNLQIVAGVWAWVRAWRRTKPYAVRPLGIRSAEIVQGREGSVLGLLALVLPPLGPAAAAAILWSKYSELPARYPAHWNGAGHIDRFVDKSPLAVFASPMISGAVLLTCLVLALAIRYGSRRGSSGEQAGWASKSRRLNLMMLTAIMWVVALMTSVLSLAPLLPPKTVGAVMPVFAVALLATVAGFAVPLIRMSWQPTGGSDPTPDECWRGGLIYNNPSDPALMVEKRDGMGYTLNFGNRIAWAILGFVLLLPILAIAVAVGLK